MTPKEIEAFDAMERTLLACVKALKDHRDHNGGVGYSVTIRHAEEALALAALSKGSPHAQA